MMVPPENGAAVYVFVLEAGELLTDGPRYLELSDRELRDHGIIAETCVRHNGRLYRCWSWTAVQELCVKVLAPPTSPPAERDKAVRGRAVMLLEAMQGFAHEAFGAVRMTKN